MAIRVGLLGLGFMGKMHMSIYAKNKDAELVAICDSTAENLTKESLSQGGNIEIGGLADFDFDAVPKYSSFDEFIKHDGLDLIDICLPTYLHSEYAVKAFENGKHVICEKPIALDLGQADKMIAAADKAGKELFISHCIRFWPEYAWLKEALDEKRYGAVKSAIFKRMAPLPVTSWDNWSIDSKLGGDGAFDLHIHDTDMINYLFGKPQDVYARASSVLSSGLDIIATQYIYDDVPVVLAVGSWGSPGSYPFEMVYTVLCEEATIEYSSSKNPTLSVYKKDGPVENPEIPPGDGYAGEIEYFIGCIRDGRKPEIITPGSARDSLEIVLKELDSAKG